MAKSQSRFVCQSCGAVFGKWLGRCEGCGSWNCISEETAEPLAGPAGALSKSKGRALQFESLAGKSESPARLKTGIAEMDRVCGGGLVAGSSILVGGDPGIGKSTLLLQAMARLADSQPQSRFFYISGEESVDQIRLRAERMGLRDNNLSLAASTSVRDIVASLEGGPGEAPRVVVIDSIQTMAIDSLESAPGTVSQVRASAQALIHMAKTRGFALLLVGHVTKEGLIAGPKVLEHMVDCVLTFEGERGHHFRILRAVKNRFGATDEIGVFEMAESGLIEVDNPSALFLSDRDGDVSGAAVFAGIEGTRPLLVEIQALVTPSSLGTPRRAVVGWDTSRLAMVLAVLEARCGLQLGQQDVFLNVAGGLRISEPSADLAVAAALISAADGLPVPEDTVVFGEIGLSGEIRAVTRHDLRLREAVKLGFKRALQPRNRAGKAKKAIESQTGVGQDGEGQEKGAMGKLATMRSQELSTLADLVSLLRSNRPKALAG